MGGSLTFKVFLGMHGICGLLACVMAIIAMSVTKGQTVHKLCGWLFSFLMLTVALIGGPLDLTRLFSPFRPYNDVNLSHFATPSTSPSHLGFFHAGFSLISMLIQALWGKNLSDFQAGSPHRFYAKLLMAFNIWNLVLGIICAFAIVVLFNPSTGALWMIITFFAFETTNFIGWLKFLEQYRIVLYWERMLIHQFNLSMLSGFAWWSALQGFLPPLMGFIHHNLGEHTGPFMGDKPGKFSFSSFFGFLLFWAISFSPAIVLWLYFRKRRLRMAAEKGELQPLLKKDEINNETTEFGAEKKKEID